MSEFITLKHIILSSLFFQPNWLHVRSNLVPDLTYDRFNEKKKIFEGLGTGRRCEKFKQGEEGGKGALSG